MSRNKIEGAGEFTCLMRMFGSQSKEENFAGHGLSWVQTLLKGAGVFNCFIHMFKFTKEEMDLGRNQHQD